MKFIQRLAWTATIITYFLIALGGTVLATDSGLSCPDWPFCNGQAFYAGTYHTFLEQFHRFTAATVSILIVLLLVGIIAWARKDRILLSLAIAAPVLLGDPDCVRRTYSSLEIAPPDYYGASGNRSSNLCYCDHNCYYEWKTCTQP